MPTIGKPVFVAAPQSKRLASAAIDFAVLVPITIVLVVFFASLGTLPPIWQIVLLVLAIDIVISVTSEALSGGKTLGRAVMGLRCVQRDGSPSGAKAALTRRFAGNFFAGSVVIDERAGMSLAHGPEQVQFLSSGAPHSVDVEVTIEIGQTPDFVFGFLIDPRNSRAANPRCESIEIIEGQIGLPGLVFHEIENSGGNRVESWTTVTWVDPGRGLACEKRSTLPSRATATYLLSPSPRGTSLGYTGRVWFDSDAPLPGVIYRAGMRRNVKRALERVKAAIESKGETRLSG